MNFGQLQGWRIVRCDMRWSPLAVPLVGMADELVRRIHWDCPASPRGGRKPATDDRKLAVVILAFAMMPCSAKDVSYRYVIGNSQVATLLTPSVEAGRCTLERGVNARGRVFIYRRADGVPAPDAEAVAWALRFVQVRDGKK